LKFEVTNEVSYCHVQLTKDSKLITRCRQCRPCCSYIVKRRKMEETIGC